jgi:hypothetical protein
MITGTWVIDDVRKAKGLVYIEQGLCTLRAYNRAVH